MSQTMQDLITAEEVTRILQAMIAGETTPDDAAAMARLLYALTRLAMAGMGKRGFTVPPGEVTEMMRRSNAVAVFLGLRPLYPEPLQGGAEDVHEPHIVAWEVGPEWEAVIQTGGR